MTQLDLFAPRALACGLCAHLGDAINTGARFCGRTLTWRWSDGIVGCAHHSEQRAMA